MVEAAVRAARKKLEEKRGVPRSRDGPVARFVVLALGKLGGTELNYSSDIDLVFLYDDDGQTDGPRPLTNQEFFDRLARDMVRCSPSRRRWAWHIASICGCGPKGNTGPVVSSLEGALHYYDVLGRTWERQAFVKARAGGGRPGLGPASFWRSSSRGSIAAI